ncbi:hypothetical protein B0J11DRAFT_176211 [Dendryphion nanum]|uniref:Uncharacterized protein n=1 Tax=Dendryphion nanum TaxID=256645 RepID=A0A9P9EEI5_9PLEO|nr:hypothetical protein B0J11DRAFT_176211 [Dendryphion nanum]
MSFASFKPRNLHLRNTSSNYVELNHYPNHSTYEPQHIPKADDKTFETNQTPARQWPTRSQRVWALTPLRAYIFFFDVLLASTPIMFIALAIMAARLNTRETGEYGRHLQKILLLSPTIFPVIFAALMGRCFKHIGLYWAERGITLGRLEQLVGCHSLFSALERQASLRAWSILGMLLTIVWFLSPLGGQSALRLLDTKDRIIESNTTYHYLDPLAIRNSFLQGSSALNSGRITYVPLFLAALLSSSQYQATPMDLWGNVKMPAWREVANSSKNDWKAIDYSKNVSYASLIGIPVAGLRGPGRSQFTLKTRQWDITCDKITIMSEKDAQFGNRSSTFKLEPAWDPTTNRTSTCGAYPCAFLLKSRNSARNYTVAQCQATYEYFEARIHCQRVSCRPDIVRKLELFGDGYNAGDDNFTRTNLINHQLSILPGVDQFAVVDAGSRLSSNAEKWMVNPWKFIDATPGNVDLQNLSLPILGERLGIVWNTFWQSTYATNALAGNLPQNLTELAILDRTMSFNATSVNVTSEPFTTYKTNWIWFSTLLICSIILQIAAYAGLVLKYLTLAPDIIGYASSLTLMNPYVPTPTGGTTLNGLERASLLHDMQIKIGDVCPNEPVGAIAVAQAGDGRIGRLDRNREYI